MTRPSWPAYFMSLAVSAASRATCPRRQVGCVIVKDRMVLSSGFNGAPPGAKHCDEVGCTMEGNHCISATHAEANAIAQAARRGVSLDGAECYCTLRPCVGCMKLLISAGIKAVFYNAYYGSSYPHFIDVTKCPVRPVDE